jgi:hypothetical protein
VAFADELSCVIRMYLNGEDHAVLCYVRLDDHEFRPVNQRTDNLV